MIPLLNARIPIRAAANVAEALAAGYLGGAGEWVGRFEAMLAARLGCDPACLVTTNSCTAAIELALHLAGVAGGRVVTTPMSFVATTTAIYRSGARPLWADVAPWSCQVDAEAVRRLVLDRAARHHRDLSARDVRAIMVVAWAGFCPDLRALDDVAWPSRRPLILDAAQALGAEFNGQPIHRFADFACYSFAPTKHLTTGDGGALVCRDPEMAERARRLAWFGLRRKLAPGERFASDQDIPEAGFKFHMNSLAAALGVAGLDGLEQALHRARENAALYRRAFAGRVLDEEEGRDRRASPYTYTIFVEDPARFTDHMAERGVHVGRPHRRNDANAFAAADRSPLPQTDVVDRHYVSIPVGWWVTQQDAEHIADAVLAYPGHLRRDEPLARAEAR